MQVRQTKVDHHVRRTPLRGLAYIGFLKALHESRAGCRYLEIGTRTGTSLALATGPAVAIDPNFNLDVKAWSARPGFSLFETTSDDYFAAHDPKAVLGGEIDIAFIDGMHLAEFVLRDFINVERHCKYDSLIFLHDILPGNFEMTERDHRPREREDTELARLWTGDVWRILPLLQQQRPDLSITVLDCGPTGLAMITKLDPHSTVLAGQQQDLVQALTASVPSEAQFWEFVEGLDVADSRALVRDLQLAA